MTSPANNKTAPEQAPEQGTEKLLADRRRKLDRLREEFKLDPFGQRVDDLVSLADARAAYDEAADDAFRAAEASNREAKKAGTPDEELPTIVDGRAIVRVAGRVVQHRVMGNLIFASLRDNTGDLQVGISKKTVGQPAFGIAKATDLSDIVAVTGRLGKTNTGELTVWAEPAPGSSAEPASAGGKSNPGGAPQNHANPQAADPLASGFAFLTKSLALPPGKFHGLTDPETRYRKRYVDLYTNPQVMQTMQLRIRIIDEIRQYLRDRGYLEVETPMLQSIHGGAAARPFKTHHNALDLPLTLRIAPELYLKRLLVGGMTKVFEINRNFRNEGISPRHNPEFTMLEAYEAYGSWETMADLVEDMVCTVAEKVFGTLIIEHPSQNPAEGASAPGEPENDSDQAGNAKTPSRQDAKRTINLTRPWKRISMVDLVEERTGWRFNKDGNVLVDAPELIVDLVAARTQEIATMVDLPSAKLSDIEKQQARLLVEKINQGVSNFEVELFKHIDKSKLAEIAVDKIIDHIGNLTPAEQLTEVYEKLIEPTLIDPCFVTRVPSVIIPLAKKCADDDFFADVYELAINGVEISPGYTELNDPDMQEQNFRGQVGDEQEQQQIDEDFLEALRVGMPPAGGIGLGIDRLVMMLTGAQSIRDVILFPLMRPQG